MWPPEKRPRILRRYHVIPLPKEREAWIIWGDADQESPEGPYPVIAAGMQIAEFSYEIDWFERKWGKDNRGRSYSPEDNTDRDDLELEHSTVWFLVLWPSYGVSPQDRFWIEMEKLCFTKEAADEELARVKAEMEAKEAKEAAKANLENKPGKEVVGSSPLPSNTGKEVE